VKIIVQRGVGSARDWCVLGRGVEEGDTCIDHYTDEHAYSPSEYVISPHQQDKAGSVLLDKIWIIYDANTVKDALQDLREDGRYKDMTIAGNKTGEEQ
jgi:hypothetical protein